jgi:hypothetical protein
MNCPERYVDFRRVGLERITYSFAMHLDEFLGAEMTARSIIVQRKDEVFAKGIAQAADGLCCVFSMGDGKLLFVSAKDRAADLDELMNDLKFELKLDDCRANGGPLDCATNLVSR